MELFKLQKLILSKTILLCTFFVKIHAYNKTTMMCIYITQSLSMPGYVKLIGACIYKLCIKCTKLTKRRTDI